MSDCLPENALVKTQQRISRIIQDDEGIRVVLADGTVEKGDIVVGCDGVNSIVRHAIWAHANEAVPNYITSTEKRSKSRIRTFECC